MQINRRTFLNWMGFGAALPVTGPLSAPPQPTQREIVLLETFIAGFQYHDGMNPDVFARLLRETGLTLQREPANKFDRNAIIVRTPAGDHIGYIPQSENKMLARMMDQGAPLETRAVKIDAQADTWERVRIRVVLRIPRMDQVTVN